MILAVACFQMYKNLDLDDFEHQFSAYQRQEGSDDNLVERMNTLTRAMAARELSVIDGRRAQNCTILLSKLKMTNSELLQAVLSVDSQEEIPKDMCEQVGEHCHCMASNNTHTNTQPFYCSSGICLGPPW